MVDHKLAAELAEKYFVDFASSLEDNGLGHFRDWAELINDCDSYARAKYGMAEDDCADELGIFDEFADTTYNLYDEVETRMLLRYFRGLKRAGNDPDDRRAVQVLAECADLMKRKGAAYNGFPQAQYYPYGLRDIWYMCWTKVKRLESQIICEGEKNFEGIEDSARDLINYAAFLVEFAEAVTWRIVATTDTFLIGWLITGKWTLGASIAGLEVVTKMAIYYFHERAWSKVK